VSGLDFASFMEKTIVQDAVLRNLQVLAESTQKLSGEFKSRHTEIEWYKISGLRNILLPDYLGIDFETVWAAVTNNLPDLKNTVQSALK
jgi:uncharacterized protein with HEPN domain